MLLTVCSERQLILSSIAKALGLPVDGIDTSKSFTELGGHSLSAVEVQHECKKIVEKPPTVLSLLVSPSIEELLPARKRFSSYQEAGPSRANTPATTDSGFVEPASFDGDMEPADTFSTYTSPEDDGFGQQTDTAEATVPSSLDRRASQHQTQADTNTTEAPATDMQVVFIRGGQSTIRYFETWRLEDVVVMKHAWKRVVSMEPIFRSVFEEDTPNSYTMRLREVSIPWEEVVTFDRQSYQAEMAKQESHLVPGFRFRSVIFRSPDCSRSEATIVLSVHHALLDGFSMEQLAEKVRRVALGEKDVAPGKSFLAAAQELDAIKKESSAEAIEFWARKSAEYVGAAASLGLPRPEGRREDRDRDRDNEVYIDFDHLTDRLHETCRALGITVASFFHAAWALVQALYTDSDKVVFGAILSGRNLPIDGISSVIGPLLNTLPLHVSIDSGSSTGDFVRRILRDLAELSCFQWSTPAHGFARNFEAALSVTRGLQAASHGHGAVQPMRAPCYDFESNIPLSMALDEAAMNLRLVYHPDCYSRETAEGLASCFVNALERLTYPTSVGQCLDSLITVPMQRRLRVLGNCISGLTTRVAHPEDLVSLFEAAVEAHPDAAAVEMGERSLSYRELDQRASQVAAALAELHVAEDEAVCVHADGSVDWVVGLMGVLKAGATMCSLDATLPHDLRTTMFAAAHSRVFVVGNESQLSFQPDDCTHCLVLDTLTASAPPARTEPCTPRRLRPSAAAYLCFTSGSTGTPKGVVCTHQGLVAFQKDVEVRLHAGPGVRVAQFMSPAFDGSIHEIFSALSYAATLVLRSTADPFAVLRRADSAIMTPSVARTLPAADFSNLKTVYLVGEQVPPSVVEQWAPGRKLYNMYGPTEGTCGATIARLTPGRAVTIGRPNPTSRVYLLGPAGRRLVPPGAVGEICIAGVQVARGYVGLPAETAARFVADPVCPGLDEMMYRTGDRGFWNQRGELVCLGRTDRQLKLRGFRLDLDDLELRIARALPAGAITAVALTRACRGDTLVAMVQPAALDPAAVRAAVARQLPRQAVPSAIACVDEFPMTRAGKVDLKAIAARLANFAA
ncbi:nonribosomal peptide synthase-like protein [Diplodia corticola]|uniref:Nonribosomal peptide synthase-like protein n=1 Tax=Diplodia corticola TaxID=236234 RepID=A0A1J9REH2_9PEZI|nr:nonribosomal peptide synthase-like protein [Diplodia corticola]OJD30963.1 nonribosomal peptide synthase-like protein [Diplodia corticola]